MNLDEILGVYAAAGVEMTPNVISFCEALASEFSDSAMPVTAQEQMVMDLARTESQRYVPAPEAQLPAQLSQFGVETVVLLNQTPMPMNPSD